MKKVKNNKKVIIVLCMMVCFTIAMATTVWAFIVTNVAADGQVTVKIEELATQIKQVTNGNEKYISVINMADTPCFVRIKIITLPNHTINITANNDWSYHEDGFWYYANMVEAKGITKILPIANADAKVMIVSEATDVWYDSNEKSYANWEKVYTH